MSDKKRRVPKLRFPGFTEDWEQRKLGELTTYRNGIGHEEKQSDIGKYELVNLNSISIDGGLKPSGKFIDEEAETLIKDDLVMVLSDVGHGDLLGRVAVIPENNRFVLNQRVALLRNNGIADIEYLFSYINAHQRYFKLQGAGSSQLNISRGSVENFEVLLPSKNEQKKIGSYFMSLDNLITLHQRRLKHWEEMKKGLLQKMLPPKGETRPRIRFPEFNEDWEQRKLGEVAKYRNGKAHENCIDDNGKYIVVNSKFVSTDGEVKKFSNMQNEALFENEIAFVLSDVPNGRAIARTFLIEKSGKYTLNQRIAGITPLKETYPYYLHILMNRHPYFLAFDDGAKQTNLSVSDVMLFESYYPIYDEQKQIGEYFRNLDHLITLHQRKLKHLQKLKKGLLQQMFI